MRYAPRYCDKTMLKTIILFYKQNRIISNV